MVKRRIRERVEEKEFKKLCVENVENDNEEKIRDG